MSMWGSSCAFLRESGLERYRVIDVCMYVWCKEFRPKSFELIVHTSFFLPGQSSLSMHVKLIRQWKR